MTDYKTLYRIACENAFRNFSLDLTGCRKPEIVTLVFEYTKAGIISKDIAELIGISPKAVQKIFRRYNFPVLHNICPPLQENRHDWKGGIKLMKGYAYKRVPNHPHGTKHGNYVAVHRLVVESELGRYLTSKEVVDHIDGDIQNNQPSNLRVFQNNAEHLRETLKGKCPNWSESGKSSLDSARRKKRLTWKGVAIQPIP